MKNSRTKKSLQKRRRRNRLRKLKVAALSLGLATAWGGEAAADATLNLSITPTVTLTNALVVYGNNRSSPEFVALGGIPANLTISFSHTFPSSEDFSGEPEYYEQRESTFPDHRISVGYFVAALYDDNGSPGVVLSFPDDTPVQLAQEWADIFETSLNTPFTKDFTEEQIVTALQAAPQSTSGVYHQDLWALMYDYGHFVINERLSPEQDTLTTHYGNQGVLVGFSTATNLGTVTAAVAPEPATWGLLITAAGVATLARRRDG